MELKEKLHNIFNGDYPGVDCFLSEVIQPVFGREISRVDGDLYNEYKQRCDNAGIAKLDYIADISTENAYNIVFLDVTLSGRINIERARVNIQALIRSIMQSYTHILIVFHYRDWNDRPWRFSYAYKEDTLSKMTPPKRFTYVFGKNFKGWTAAERLSDLSTKSRTDEEIVEAFSVEALSKEFFDIYRDRYADFVQFITGCRYEKVSGKWEEHQLHEADPQFYSTFERDKKMVRDYVKKMFGRIVFLYFLQRKGWLDGNYNYMQDLWEMSQYKDDFLDRVLEPLFFDVLNTEKRKRGIEAKELPGCEDIPYLNGGLFAQEEIDIRTCRFPRGLFQRLFDFLNNYNFTIDENDAEDSEIGIDPEMLGRIFESLLEDNKDKGAYYTPKFIVDYMCRESIIAYLCNGFEPELYSLIREFVESLNGDILQHEQKVKIANLLLKIRICDPAIGSGAFPMGIVNLLSKLYISLKAETNTTEMKRHIMEQNIYGVDIEKGAVDIARLRFWLAMIVDETEQKPLPNLNFKIMQGNSLLESYENRDLCKLVYGQDKERLDFFEKERKSLQKEIKSYYDNSDHTKSGPQLNSIKNKIRTWIFDTYSISLPDDCEGGDPSANQFFFLWHTWFSEVFDYGGFDIVIGNPPYIQLQNNQGELGKLYENENFKTFTKTGDIYCLFYEMGIRLLNDHGHLCFITSNKWMKAGYGKKLRGFLASNTNPKTLIDFGSVKIFESASVDTNIILVSKESNVSTTLCVDANGHTKEEIKELSKFVAANGIICNFIDDGSWNISSPIEARIKAKMEAIGMPLKDWNIEINYGVKTGLNEAFVINTEKREEILSKCKDKDEYNRTVQIIKPFLRGKDIKDYSYQWNGTHLIWLPWHFPMQFDDTIQGASRIAEEEFATQYPSVYSHMCGYKQKLSARNKAETGKRYEWYALQRWAAKYWQNFSKPKIIYPDISQRMSFVLDFKGYVPNNTTYFMVGLEKEKLVWLASILNSKLYNWYYKTISAQLGGAAIRMFSIYVLEIPVPDCYPNTDLYSIFGLTPEEISYIESLPD